MCLRTSEPHRKNDPAFLVGAVTRHWAGGPRDVHVLHATRERHESPSFGFDQAVRIAVHERDFAVLKLQSLRRQIP